MGEWTQVPTKVDGRPRTPGTSRRDGLESMRSRLAAPPQGSKGKGKGKGSGKPKGASQGTPPKTQPPPASQEGPARRRPNLKPNEERAMPTLIEIKCQKCQEAGWAMMHGKLFA